MWKRPLPGRKIIVLKKRGLKIECFTTHVTSANGSGIVIYHNGKAIDEMTADGWWYL